MSHNVIVSGLPEIPKLNKLVFIFKSVLEKVGVTNFWIKRLDEHKNSTLHQALVEFYSSADACLAVKILNGYRFCMGEVFPLSARADRPYSSSHRSRSPRNRHKDSRHQDRGGRKRSRSRSPFDLEASKLDLEIELLKKKRQIIEEERRLLLERKKLELDQAFGPSALKNFDDFEEPCDRERRYRSRRSEESYKESRLSPRRTRTPSKRPDSRLEPQRHGPEPPKPRRAQFLTLKAAPIVRIEQSKDVRLLRVPQFYMPCKVILKEMNDMVEKHATPEEIGHVHSLIKSALRSRFAVIVDKKPVLSADQIVNMYRVKHPKGKDESFVLDQIKNLRACHLPSETNEDETKRKGKMKNKTGTAEKVKLGSPGNSVFAKFQEVFK